MVGDGDAVGIAGQVVKDVLRSAEGRLGIDATQSCWNRVRRKAAKFFSSVSGKHPP